MDFCAGIENCRQYSHMIMSLDCSRDKTKNHKYITYRNLKCLNQEKFVKALHYTVAHICHGKTYFSTAKLTFPRQNLLSHGKTYFSTAKLTFPRQNLLFHGKTYFSTAKLTFPRQNLLFHGKTHFFTAKLTFSYFRLPVSLCLQFPAVFRSGN